MKQIFASLLVLLALSSFTVSAQAQEGIAGVTVTLCDADGKVVAKAKTDRDGMYDISVTRAHSDYYLKIDEKDRKSSKFAIKEQGVKQASMPNDDDASSSSRKGYEYYMSVNAAKGYTVKSPRDAASGQASGKRQSSFQYIINPDTDGDGAMDACAIAIDEPGVHITGQIYGMAINEKGLPGEKKPKPKSTK